MKSLTHTTVWTASSTLFKILIGLVSIKLLASTFGTDGVGLAANYMTLLTVLSVFAGAGIFNGITKYVAEFEQKNVLLREILSTASLIILLFSFLLGTVLFIWAQPIAILLFGQNAELNESLQNSIKFTALCQFAIALANYFLAVLKGFRAAKAVALSTILGSVIGLLLFLCSFFLFGYTGALIGLVLLPASLVIPSYYFLKQQLKQANLHWADLTPKLYLVSAKRLLTYSVMVLITAISVPWAYVLIRNQLSAYYSLSEVGLWQGVSKISDAYLQFITAAFSVYLLPTFAKLQEKHLIKKELYKALVVVFIFTSLASVGIYLLRNWIILLLYSEQFMAMRELFLWQLIGDIFKVMAYVFGYLIIAKGAIRWYFLAELTQVLLLFLFSNWLVPAHGAVGATQSYMLTYIIYFTCCLIAGHYYLQCLKTDG